AESGRRDRLSEATINRGGPAGERRGSCRHLWRSRDRGGLRDGGDFRRRVGTSDLRRWRYCARPGSDEQLSLSTNGTLAPNSVERAAARHRKIDNRGNAIGGGVWLSRAHSGNPCPNQSRETCAQTGSRRRDGWLLATDRRGFARD